MPDDRRASRATTSIDVLIGDALLLDLETGADGKVHKIGALRGGREFRRAGRFDMCAALEALTSFAGDARYVIGHNLLGEHRYGRHGTPRPAPSRVTTRWNRITIPPRCALLDAARDAP